MSTVAFNSVSGYTVGQNPAKNIILANGDITTINFTANGVSNLGPISNVKITGGTSGQAITTDGSGNLTFTTVSGSSNLAAPMPYYIATASSYSVSANFQGLFATPITIDGTLAIDGILIDVSNAMNSLDQQVLFDSNAVVTGNVGFTFNSTTGNLGVPGAIAATGNISGANLALSAPNVTAIITDTYAINSTIVQLQVKSGTQSAGLAANLGPGTYNGLVNANDTGLVFSTTTQGNANFAIVPWASGTSGIRISSVSNVATITLAATTTNVTGNLSAVGNVQTSSNIVWANSSNTTKAYQFYNSATTSIDTVFV
jgi:hypothetical protein